ncbi:MAG: hypothetical protein KF729_36425 [Sandaracinaceae bacterium]|nr:hypothetical protein [Sandaracinaceae bacterium]
MRYDEDELEDDFDDDEEEDDFGETELDRNAGDYGPTAHGLVEAEDESRTIPVDPPAPARAAEPIVSGPASAPRARGIAKTAPLLPSQRPPEVDDDIAPTALDREPMDPARPPRGHGPGAPRVSPRAPDRLPEPPLPVPSSDLPLKLLLAALIAVIVLLVAALAFGVLHETGRDHGDRGFEGVRP